MTAVLTTLEFLRKTLLQDVAVILDKHPDHIIRYMSPFNTIEFKRYAAHVVKAHSSGTLSCGAKEKLAKMTAVLTTLEFLRKTLLQDVAVILDKHPDHIIGYMSPFNTVEFKRYAAQVVKAHSSGTLSGSDKEKLAKMTDVLTTLEFLRKTLLQDVAVILDKHPDHIIGYMSPFNTVEFKRYAAQVVKAHSSGTLSGSDKEKLAKMTDVLTTLEFLRKTLLQDVAVILDKHPDHIIGYMSPFNTVEFKRYAAQVVKAHSSGTLSGSDKEKLAKMTDVLTTLEFLRKTLLQDVAVILDKHPDHIIGYMSPFNTVEFKR
ncbi:unnamed protein product [Ambrosiozyma monospora]|uniref:Unnamed protein product n=1 Tax=Ambrosiozyma monospora TaxID=43982 RepID=A0A9W7DIX5_AMBMO|nr:unnamed protein product [Ambrosiozyma monospora]